MGTHAEGTSPNTNAFSAHKSSFKCLFLRHCSLISFMKETHHVTLLLLLGVPGLPAPRPQLENRIAGSAPALPSVPPPVWVPVHPLNAHCVGFSASWGVGQRHLCFVVHVYRLWMEGERQRQLFAPPSPQVPVLCPESADSV